MSGDDQQEALRLISIGRRIAQANFPPDEARRRGMLAKVLLDVGKQEGPAITVAELARLVDVRLRSRFKDKKPDAEKIAEEIESTLDLVESCQWLLHARRVQWQTRTHEYAKSILEKPLTEQEKEIKAQKYRLAFDKGLICMGVPGNNAKEREAKYFEHFKSRYALGKFMSSGGSYWDADALAKFEQPPESETRECFELNKVEGWQNVELLLSAAESWRRWWEPQKVKMRSAAGKASGEARKPRAKRKK